MNICLILGLLCLVYGLTVAIAGSGGTKFFIVWIGIAVILFALAGSASYGNVGQNTADDQMDIWDIMRRIFSVVSCDRGNGDLPDACAGRKKSGLCDRAGCTGARG